MDKEDLFVIDNSGDASLRTENDIDELLIVAPERSRGVGKGKTWRANKGKSRKRQQGPEELQLGTAGLSETSESETDDSETDFHRPGLGHGLGFGSGPAVVIKDPVDSLLVGPSAPSSTLATFSTGQRANHINMPSQHLMDSDTDEDEDEEGAILKDFLENADQVGPEDVISPSVFSAVVGLDASDDDDDDDSEGLNDISDSESATEGRGPSGAPSSGLSKAGMKKQRKLEKKARLKAKRERIQGMEAQARKIQNGIKQGSRSDGNLLHTLLAPINSAIRNFVLDPAQPDIGSLPPMPAKVRRPALRMAAAYRLKTGTQGHGAAKYTTLYRTQLTSVPQDWNHLVEKVLEESPSTSEMSNTISKHVSKADRRRGGSAVVRLDKDQARPAAAGYEIGEEVGGDAAPITSGIGFKLMEKMGWSAGTGLGKSRQDGDEDGNAIPVGITEPVTVKILAKRRGLGHHESGL